MSTDSEAAEVPGQPARTLAHALRVMRPLARWLVRVGIGHKALSEALKPVFLEAARAEMQRGNQIETASGLSLLSGLHRKDVRALGENPPASVPTDRPARATPAQTLVSHWLAQDLPRLLPMMGDAPSFDALARSVSLDVHPRTLLRELERLGVAEEIDGGVQLRREAFVPDRRLDEASRLMSESAADHLAAGVHNLTGEGPVRFLEQSVFADRLTEASIQELEALGNKLWKKVLADMVKAAVLLETRDAAGHAPPITAPDGQPVPARADQRLRLGIFCYSTRMESLHPHPSAKDSSL